MLTRFKKTLPASRGTKLLDELYEILPGLTCFDEKQAAYCAMIISSLADYWERVRPSLHQTDRQILAQQLRELYEDSANCNVALASGIYIISLYIECVDLPDEHGKLVYNLAKLYIRRSNSILSGE